MCRICQERSTCQCTTKIMLYTVNVEHYLYCPVLLVCHNLNPPFCLTLISSLRHSTRILSSKSTSRLSPVSAYQSTSPLVQQSPLNLDLEKELKVSVPISIFLDCKVASLTKHQDRVDLFVIAATWYGLFVFLVIFQPFGAGWVDTSSTTDTHQPNSWSSLR